MQSDPSDDSKPPSPAEPRRTQPEAPRDSGECAINGPAIVTRTSTTPVHVRPAVSLRKQATAVRGTEKGPADAKTVASQFGQWCRRDLVSSALEGSESTTRSITGTLPIDIFPACDCPAHPTVDWIHRCSSYKTREAFSSYCILTCASRPGLELYRPIGGGGALWQVRDAPASFWHSHSTNR